MNTSNTNGIRFDVTNFEFDHILSNPSLLQKTTFIQNSNLVDWNGEEFIMK